MFNNLHKTALFALVLLWGQQATAQRQLWYDKPAIEWEEALPVGNGILGAMIFGGVETEHLQFNEESLWTGYPRNYNKKDAYQYLDTIRQLIDQGKQAEAEALAMKEFMGLKSTTEDSAAWLESLSSMREDKLGPSAFDYDDSKWKKLTVPSYEGWETVGLEAVDGAIWFRTKVNLSKKDLQADWLLDLNRIRDIDYTYINGQLIGNKEGENTVRQYVVPKGLLKEGENTIAIQVINLFGKGGIAGYKDTSRHIGLVNKNTEELISINGEWKYMEQDLNAPLVGQFQAAYQPFGDINIHFNHNNPSSYKRELDLEQSEVRVSYDNQGVHYTRRYFSSFPDKFIGMEFNADKPGELQFSVDLSSKHAADSVWRVDDKTLALGVKVKNGALHGVSLLRIQADDAANIEVSEREILVEKGSQVRMYLTAATNYRDYKHVDKDAFASALALMEKASSQRFDSLVARHREDYKSLYDRFNIEFKGADSDKPTDVRLENFHKHPEKDLDFMALYVQYGRYLLISSSRAGVHPANLQGIWNHHLEPSWGSKYTTNINLEMNYWPSEVLNIQEVNEPFFNFIQQISEVGKETAREYYNARGWVIHHNTDVWRGTAPINNSNHGIWPTAGAWFMHHIWEHYLYNQDLSFLKKYYPIIKGATVFFKDHLVEDPKTGWLVSTPSNSPEYGGLVKGPTMDHQLIRNLFKIFVSSSELMKQDEALRDSIGVMASQIAPNQIGQYGQLQEWIEDLDDPNNKHRHVSHLWGLHPGSEVNWEDTPELIKAAKRTLEMRGDEGTGWSLAWKINFWARLLDSEKTMKLISMLLSPATTSGGSYANLFDAHPPFQIDGNFGGAAGIVEMLVQSHTSYIDILPALPKDLKSGSISGVKLRGGFQADLSWDEHQLSTFVITSQAGNTLRLKYKDKTIQLETKPGASYAFDAKLRLISE